MTAGKLVGVGGQGAAARGRLIPSLQPSLSSRSNPTHSLMAQSTLLDEGIRVTVVPSQAAYFAGDVFSVTITVTNVRTPQTPLPAKSTSSQSATYGHRRGAHSVSYVPMARPPTSPGIRTALPASAPLSGGRSSAGRRGLIGIGRSGPSKSTDHLSQPVDQARRRLNLNKSLSVSLPPHSNGQDEWTRHSPMRISSPTIEAPSHGKSSEYHSSPLINAHLSFMVCVIPHSPLSG